MSFSCPGNEIDAKNRTIMCRRYKTNNKPNHILETIYCRRERMKQPKIKLGENVALLLKMMPDISTVIFCL